MGHRLVIDSLRDLKARCTCGEWELSSTTTSRDTAKALRQHAQQAHRQHIRSLIRACTSA